MQMGSDDNPSKRKSLASGSESGQKRDLPVSGSAVGAVPPAKHQQGSEGAEKRDLPASSASGEVPSAKRQHVIQPKLPATSAVGAQSAAALPATSAAATSAAALPATSAAAIATSVALEPTSSAAALEPTSQGAAQSHPQSSQASDVASASGDEGEGGPSLTQFLQEAKAWLKAEVIDVAKSSSPPRSIPSRLVALFPPTSDIKKQIVARIPWKTQNGYVSFLRTPTNNCKGQIHVSMLSYDESSFAGQGVYLEDALLVLGNWELWSDSVICVRPKGVGIAHDTFGWVCDGAIINATRGFAMIAVAIFAAVVGGSVKCLLRV